MDKVSIMNSLLRLRHPAGAPIAVVGNGRSGTSWIGKTLAQAVGVLYYREPCNPSTTGVTDDTVWSRFVPPQGRDAYFEEHLDAAFQGLTSTRYGAGGKRFLPRMIRPSRALVKEVAAFPSIEWMYLRWKPLVLIVVRHPCDCALSVQKAGLDTLERSRLDGLINNTYLREHYLGPYAQHLSSAQTALEVSSAIWAIKNLLALEAKQRYPEWSIVRYEDLCADPIGGFRALYSRFDLPWSEDIDRWVKSTTQEEAPGTYATSRVTARQSNRWKKKLHSDEVAQVRRIVEPFNLPYYSDASEW